MRIRRTPAALFVMFFALSAAFLGRAGAETFSNPYPMQTSATIQVGINVADSTEMDRVLVAPGTYYENIDFQGQGHHHRHQLRRPRHHNHRWQFQGRPCRHLQDRRDLIQHAISASPIRHGGYFSGPAGSIYLLSSTPTILNNIITLKIANVAGIDSHYSAPLSFRTTPSQSDPGS